jgi:hypothetical protein
MTELDPGDRSRVLMLLSDGVAGDQQEAMRGVHDVVGAGMPLVGGCAGDGVKMERTFQLHGDEVIAGGVVSAAIASTGPLLLGEDRIAEEVAAITACAGEAPFAGLYTYGEIARVRGVNALHGQTFVAMAIG